MFNDIFLLIYISFFLCYFFFTFSFWMWLETIMWLSLWERQDQGRQLSWRRSVCGCGNTEWESSMKYWKFYTATISSLLLWLNKYSWASNFVHLVKCKFVDIPKWSYSLNCCHICYLNDFGHGCKFEIHDRVQWMMLRWIKAVCIRSLRPRGYKTFGHVFSVHKFKLCSIILTIL